jgi:hypothetical protein
MRPAVFRIILNPRFKGSGKYYQRVILQHRYAGDEIHSVVFAGRASGVMPSAQNPLVIAADCP